VRIKISPNDKGNPPGKLADAEIHFEDADGALSGLKLIGFGLWEGRYGRRRNVTFPARQYSVNGERRSFALLRPACDGAVQEPIIDLIREAYDRHIENRAIANEDADTPTTWRGATIDPPPAPPAGFGAVHPDAWQNPPAPEPTIAAIQAAGAAIWNAEPAPAIDGKRPIGLDVPNDAIAQMTDDEQRRNREEVRAQVAAGRPILLTDILTRAGKPKTPTHPAPTQPAIDF
jgi:hypothetical protein